MKNTSTSKEHEEVFNVSENSTALDKMLALLNRNVPVSLLIKFSTDPDWSIRSLIASHPNSPLALVEQLASDSNPEVRMGVTKNSNILPVDLLAKLSEDAWEEIRTAVARRHEFVLIVPPPVAILGKLAKDKNWNVRAAVAENPFTPAPMLEKLAVDTNSNVLQALASNYTLPSHLAAKLITSRYHLVRKNLARNPYLPSTLIIKLAKDPVAEVRLATIKTHSLPFNDLIALMKDPAEEVQEAAIETWDKLSTEDFNNKIRQSEHTHLIGLPKDWVRRAFNL